MIWLLLIHIGLPIGMPLILGLAFTGFRATANTEIPSWHIAMDAALDLAILGIGATGAIFESSTVQQAMGQEGQTITGVLIMIFGLMLAGCVLVIKRFFFAKVPDHPFLLCVASFILGSLALIAASTVLVYVYDKASFGVTTLIETLAVSVNHRCDVVGLCKIDCWHYPSSRPTGCQPRTQREGSRRYQRILGRRNCRCRGIASTA